MQQQLTAEHSCHHGPKGAAAAAAATAPSVPLNPQKQKETVPLPAGASPPPPLAVASPLVAVALVVQPPFRRCLGAPESVKNIQKQGAPYSVHLQHPQRRGQPLLCWLKARAAHPSRCRCLVGGPTMTKRGLYSARRATKSGSQQRDKKGDRETHAETPETAGLQALSDRGGSSSSPNGRSCC